MASTASIGCIGGFGGADSIRGTDGTGCTEAIGGMESAGWTACIESTPDIDCIAGIDGTGCTVCVEGIGCTCCIGCIESIGCIGCIESMDCIKSIGCVEGIGCIGCVGCIGCIESMDCVGCIGCIKSMDCVGCVEGIGCIKSMDCVGCPKSIDCIKSMGCVGCSALFVSAKKSSSKGIEGGGAAAFVSFSPFASDGADTAGNARKLKGSELDGAASGFSAGRSDSGLLGVSLCGGRRESGWLERAERSKELEKEAPWRMEAARSTQTSHCSSLIFRDSFTSTKVQI